MMVPTLHPMIDLFWRIAKNGYITHCLDNIANNATLPIYQLVPGFVHPHIHAACVLDLVGIYSPTKNDGVSLQLVG